MGKHCIARYFIYNKVSLLWTYNEFAVKNIKFYTYPR